MLQSRQHDGLLTLVFSFLVGVGGFAFFVALEKDHLSEIHLLFYNSVYGFKAS